VAVASAGLYASLHLIPDNHAKIPPLKFFTGRMPFLTPNQQRQSTEGITSQTSRQIFMPDGLNDADSRKDVPFRVLLILLTIK